MIFCSGVTLCQSKRFIPPVTSLPGRQAGVSSSEAGERSSLLIIVYCFAGGRTIDYSVYEVVKVLLDQSHIHLGSISYYLFRCANIRQGVFDIPFSGFFIDRRHLRSQCGLSGYRATDSRTSFSRRQYSLRSLETLCGHGQEVAWTTLSM